MSNIFSKIVNNETPSFKVAEDENYLAFLDAFPLSYGHVLVIPKKETNYLFDLDSDPFEEKNLFHDEKYTEVIESMKNSLIKWQEINEDSFRFV